MKTLLLPAVFLVFVGTAISQKSDSLKHVQKSTKAFEKSSDFVRIPDGSFFRGNNDSDLPYADMNGNYGRARTISVPSFFMQKYEVSNGQYLEFVNDILKQDSVLGASFLPDTLVWRKPNYSNEPYVEYYFRHPAYANYPVVGVSYNQAKAFAEWYTKKQNANPDRVFQEVNFRLPSEEEWEYAAKGGNDHAYLPWGDFTTIDEDGLPRANFRMVSQLSVYREEVTLDPNGKVKSPQRFISTGMGASLPNQEQTDMSDITVPVKWYAQNPYGLYQMAGNVAEMVDAYYDRDISMYEFSHDPKGVKSEEPWGITKGGGWRDTGFYLQYPVRQYYENQTSTSSSVGFRLAMDVVRD